MISTVISTLRVFTLMISKLENHLKWKDERHHAPVKTIKFFTAFPSDEAN